MDVNQLSQRLTMRWIEICSRRGRHPRAPSAAELTTIQVLLHAILSGPQTELDSSRVNIHGSLQGNQLWSTIQSLDKQMDTYEDPDLLDQATALIPLQELHDSAERIQASNTPLPCFEDALADVLVKCLWRGNGIPRIPRSHGRRTKRRANRVEMHVCKDPKCNGNFRFARYNNPAVLMRTRVGRCGEFANLFTLFLRAMGLRAQYVWNREDHVWNSHELLPCLFYRRSCRCVTGTHPVGEMGRGHENA
ncbi:hypothetical protein JB92DRAFT_176389 [Gautieria morchelliformis]|nr:hypothetical protein JB92DRAFT_176389 [Gautieria morchelliformis]